ncbi:hypothetical protein [Mycobacterium sp. E3198]|uniref:hypothetical protein n=1 Tax=Mycobacterium sp. E3198 TaxID=1834143 RepID=UPI001E5118B0|nr:hypothetical protein [Mycobacterium sp. E3198]
MSDPDLVAQMGRVVEAQMDAGHNANELVPAAKQAWNLSFHDADIVVVCAGAARIYHWPLTPTG